MSKKDDIFEEALAMSLPSNLNNKDKKETEVKVVEENILDQAKAMTIDNAKSSWSVMKEKINNGYTDRAMRIMDELPDREFLKTWLKLQEYVNPKITRKEKVDVKEENKHIKITIEHHDKKEDTIKTIDIS